MKNVKTLIAGITLSLILMACRKGNETQNVPGGRTTMGTSSQKAADSPDGAGFVYTLSNQVSGNSVISFSRSTNGMLTMAGAVATGGLGTGAGLGSQGALSLSSDGQWLFAVNAGSDDISVLKTSATGLTLVTKVASGGIRPISITNYSNLVYVLNAGGSGNISGFYLGGDGSLSVIPNSTRPLSSMASGPAQISFTSGGQALAVTEKATSKIIAYDLDAAGVPGPLHELPSATPVPFGFAVGRQGNIFVTEAAQSALTAYHVDKDAMVSQASPAVPDGQAAACWAVITNNGKYVYVANAATGNISSYRISQTDDVMLLNGVAGNTGTGSSPIDEALSANSKFLYVVESGTHTIGAFAVNSDGSLTNIGDFGNLPVGDAGLVAY